MRISNSMMINRLMRNLNNNMRAIDKTMLQAATGKKIQRPSDDPVAISKGMKLKTDLLQLQQYKKNVDDTVSFLETTELAVKNVGDAIDRIRDLVVQASNGVPTGEDLLKIKEEITELKSQIISIGNTTYAGKYVFSGKKTDQPLFNDAGEYQVNLGNAKDPGTVDDKIQFEVGINDLLEINTLGFEVFDSVTHGNIAVVPPPNPNEGDMSITNGQKSGLIQLIEQIEIHLENEEYGNLSASLDAIDHYKDLNLTARAQIGAKVNRMELVQNRIADDIINFKSLKSELEDADMAEVYTELLAQENVYRSSLSIGARIIQPTLLDFLR